MKLRSIAQNPSHAQSNFLNGTAFHVFCRNKGDYLPTKRLDVSPVERFFST